MTRWAGSWTRPNEPASLPTGGPRGYLVLMAVASGPPRSQLALAQQLTPNKTVMTYLLDDLEAARLESRLVEIPTRRRRRPSRC
jgi:hypothetical protein